jgi:hypothetical protein
MTPLCVCLLSRRMPGRAGAVADLPAIVLGVPFSGRCS